MATEARVTSRTSWPSIVSDPDATSYSRGTRPDRVVLPAPDGPTRAVMVPGSATKDTPRSTHAPGSVSSPSPTVSAVASSEATDTSAAAG